MLDKLFVLPSEQHDHHMHFNVQMVDPSVEKGARFLDEVQTKAAERIRNAIVAEVPSISAEVVLYETDLHMPTDEVRQMCAFKVNGHAFDVRVSEYGKNPEKLAQAISEAITAELMRRILREPLFWRKKYA